MPAETAAAKEGERKKEKSKCKAGGRPKDSTPSAPARKRRRGVKGKANKAVTEGANKAVTGGAMAKVTPV